MLKRAKPLDELLTEEGLARNSNKQHSENTYKWHLCKTDGFSYSESLRDPSPLGNFTPPVKQWCGETLGDLEPDYHLFTSAITLATGLWQWHMWTMLQTAQ